MEETEVREGRGPSAATAIQATCCDTADRAELLPPKKPPEQIQYGQIWVDSYLIPEGERLSQGDLERAREICVDKDLEGPLSGLENQHPDIPFAVLTRRELVITKAYFVEGCSETIQNFEGALPLPALELVARYGSKFENVLVWSGESRFTLVIGVHEDGGCYPLVRFHKIKMVPRDRLYDAAAYEWFGSARRKLNGEIADRKKILARLDADWEDLLAGKSSWLSQVPKLFDIG